jgi:diguanylate cyclase (GGDEF)-like protein
MLARIRGDRDGARRGNTLSRRHEIRANLHTGELGSVKVAVASHATDDVPMAMEVHIDSIHALTPASSPKPPLRRLRIGVVLDDMDGEYHQPLLDGVCKMAERLGIDLIFMPGHLPGTPQQFEQQFGMVFRMAREHAPDGLLIFGTLMQGHLDEDGLRCFVSTFSPLPAVVVGVCDTGHPTVLVDNRCGFKDLVLHLINVHGHRHIAMVEGPTENRDAQERLAAYLDAHREAGIPADPMLRVPGAFHQASGSHAMEQLLARNVPFTALVCANDESAQGALSVAVERGMRVPEDVAIAGFDDLLSIYHVGPSLTSVNQDIPTQGATALLLLARRLQCEAVPALTTIPTRPVFRRTCGCMGWVALGSKQSQSLPECAQALVAQMEPPEDLADSLVQDVVALVEALANSEGRAAFNQILTRMAFAWHQRQSDITPLQNLLVAIQRTFVGTLECADPGEAAERLQVGQMVLANMLELFHTRARVALSNNGWALRHELKSQVTTVDIDALLCVLSDALKRLGVVTCMLALYDQPTTLEEVEREGLPGTSRLVLALDQGEQRNDVIGTAFATARLLPVALATSTAARRWVVLPMFYMQEHFGYMLLERQHEERVTFADLHHEITGALHSCLVVKELASARDALRLDLDRARRDNEALSHLAMRDELTGLFNRRGFFELARSMMSTARLTEQPLTLFFADLDGLKQINDRHGHKEGDEAIRAAAKVLQATFRQDDVVSRLGGDEFVILTRANNLESLPEIERRLDKHFSEFDASTPRPYRLGCSLGGTVIVGDAPEVLERVLARADQLLYAAKRRRKAAAAPGASAGLLSGGGTGRESE